MRHIEINASEKLLEYMDRKGYHCIAVEPLSPKGVRGSIWRDARFGKGIGN